METRRAGAAPIHANAPNNQMSGLECYILPSNYAGCSTMCRTGNVCVCVCVWCGNKETGLLLLLISGHVDDEEEGRALTRGLPSTVTQRFIHAHR